MRCGQPHRPALQPLFLPSLLSPSPLTLREAAYPPVQYIPAEDVDFSQLERTDHATHCPYKGDCHYYSIPAGGKKSANAVWSYDDPSPAVAQIEGLALWLMNTITAPF